MLVKGSKRIVATSESDPATGVVRWRPIKSIWIGAMTIIGIGGGALTASWDAAAVFLVLSAVTLCAGHSVGMHRLMIHRSFACPVWLEYVLVYLGVLVGMAGPFGMMRQHDLRDWAQRQTQCHDYLCHKRGIALDGFWQLHCDVALKNAPAFKIEDRIANDPVYVWLERTWMLQQAPIAIALYLLGGWSWVIWGVALRVAVCVTGHWLVGYFAHNEDNDHMTWRVNGASVQGRDVPLAGLISMGESWHNNHHAYPGSAKIGLLPGQPDPGWWLISTLRAFGLAWSIRTPETMPMRLELVRLKVDADGCPACNAARRFLSRGFHAA